MTGFLGGVPQPGSGNLPVRRAAKTTRLEWPLGVPQSPDTAPDNPPAVRGRPAGLFGNLRSQLGLPPARPPRTPAPAPSSAPTAAAGAEPAPPSELELLRKALSDVDGLQEQLDNLSARLTSAVAGRLWSTLNGLLGASPRAESGAIGGRELVSQVLSDLADPASICQGDGTDTCTITSLQVMLARSMPDEYARIVGDLLTTGETRLKDGTVVQSQERDFQVQEGRTAVSDAFQESLYRLGQSLESVVSNGRGPDRRGRGRNVTGSLQGGSCRRFGRFSLRACRATFAGQIEGGLSAMAFNALFRKVTGSNATVMDPIPGLWQDMAMRKNLDRLNVTALLKPEGDSGVGHAVVVERVFRDRGKLVVQFDDPAVKGNQVLPLADFKARVEQMVVPPGMASRAMARHRADALATGSSNPGGVTGLATVSRTPGQFSVNVRPASRTAVQASYRTRG
ncbi:MAG: hypothetical protein VKP72_05310 [bacterium]|nr:hypothetical protein [bacterium]